MLFASLVFISAFLIESIGSYISIVGLSALFSTNPVIITLALSLDIAKIITVSFLYKQWNAINKIMKIYMTVAAVILMVITSSGAAGYLSAEFQKAMMPTKESDIIVKTMVDEKTKLEARKLEIDRQIAQLPAESVRGRTKLMKQFDGEISHINTRLVEIDKALPEIQIKQVDVNAHAGPILYVAQAFDTTVEAAVKYVILLIIFVFDPLAVALIIAGNFLVDQHKKKQDEISYKLDLLQKEVHHIEEELAAPTDKEVFECTFPGPEDRLGRGSEVETLPEVELEIPPPAEDGFDVNDWVEVEEELQEPPKKKRGRKKKEESEPKPTITTEEQLSDVVGTEISVADEIIVQVEEAQPVMTVDTPVEIPEDFSSSLNAVNQNKADVSFLEPSAADGTWKPTKKVMNIYHKP